MDEQQQKQLHLLGQSFGITYNEFLSLTTKQKYDYLIALTKISSTQPIENIRKILTSWANLEGHDKCWHHPEILTELCNILQIPIKDPPVLPSREAFEDGCRCYADKLYPNTSLENNHKLCGSNNDIQGTIRYGPLYEIFYGEYKEGFGSLKGYKYYQLLGDYPVIDGNPDKFTPTFILCNRRPPYDHLYNEFKRNYIDFTRITEIDFDNLLYSWYCRPLMEITS